MNEEIKLLIKLRHPDPFVNPTGFIDSLSDKFIDEYFYITENKVNTIENRRDRARRFYAFIGGEERIESLSTVLTYLDEYYGKENVE